MMNKQLIYDVGMNNGDDTAYYLHRGFNVVAIEADPSLCKEAAIRFNKEINQGRLQLLNVGVAKTEGVANFWICESRSAWNSFNIEIASRDGLPHHSIEVPCQPFEQILERFGVPHYLKIDIEGNDILCLNGLQNYLSTTGCNDVPLYISVEIGQIDKFLEILISLGYSHFKLISQYNYLPLQIPPSKMERSFVFLQYIEESDDQLAKFVRRLSCTIGKKELISRFRGRSRRCGKWDFPWGSSGPFGEDSPGKWQEPQDIITVFNSFSEMAKQKVSSSFWNQKDYSFWVDLHATRVV